MDKLVNRPKSFKPNVERNEKLYFYWKSGYTVEKTSAVTGIPGSSVGYYFNKFNKCAREGKPIAFPQQDVRVKFAEQSGSDYDWRVYKNFLNCKNAMRIMADNKFEELFYRLSCMKLLKELWNEEFSMTDEEFIKYALVDEAFEKSDHSYNKVFQSQGSKIPPSQKIMFEVLKGPTKTPDKIPDQGIQEKGRKKRSLILKNSHLSQLVSTSSQFKNLHMSFGKKEKSKEKRN